MRTLCAAGDRNRDNVSPGRIKNLRLMLNGRIAVVRQDAAYVSLLRIRILNTRYISVVIVKRAELTDFRFHDLRHTWASWHRQAGTSTDELKDLGGWKSRVMVDRYAKFGTEHLSTAASRIEGDRPNGNVIPLRFRYGGETKKA